MPRDEREREKEEKKKIRTYWATNASGEFRFGKSPVCGRIPRLLARRLLAVESPPPRRRCSGSAARCATSPVFSPPITCPPLTSCVAPATSALYNMRPRALFFSSRSDPYLGCLHATRRRDSRPADAVRAIRTRARLTTHHLNLSTRLCI
ncbi:hypothetical protein PUN28_016284 [Cardiocondyla obscurior]|uniref:Uncharacterized protein n=1 Tax=Cardiocondyla obscurior TaxID=286306 RepID=A0AAW2EU53_9HYME